MDNDKITTEEKILNAARKVFSQKGFSDARTRDIAQEAGINIALLNYYFRSKDNLVKIVIEEKFRELFDAIIPIVSNENIPLEEKIGRMVDHYYGVLTKNPDIPIFIFHEVRANNRVFEMMIQKARPLAQPVIEKQLAEMRSTVTFPNFIMNIVGLTMMPFISKPLLNATGVVSENEYSEFVINRKKNIVKWVMNTLK